MKFKRLDRVDYQVSIITIIIVCASFFCVYIFNYKITHDDMIYSLKERSNTIYHLSLIHIFVKLVKEGFYDGLTFHRIIDGFMIQGGDPKGNGTGGSDETIKGEFSSNGVENPLKHTRGAISMARSSDPDSASSQFFIMHQTTTSLDGDYAVFGYVYEGIEVVDKIATTVPVTDNNGTVEASNQPVITSIKMLK